MEQAFLSTTAPAEWAEWAGQNTEVRNGALALSSQPAIDYTNLRVEAVDISVDREGNVLFLDADGDVGWHDGEHGLGETVWSNGDGERLETPRALCVAGDRVYLVDGATGELVLVSRRSGSAVGRVETRLTDPREVIRADQRIYILDAGADDRQGRVFTLRRNGTVETVVRGLDSPTDITADSSHLYVVEQPEETPVVRVHEVGHLDSPSIIPTSETLDDFVPAEGEAPVRPVRIEVLTDQELVVVGRTDEAAETGLYHYTFEGDGGTLTWRDEFALSCSTLVTGPRTQDRRYPKYYAVAGGQQHVYIVDERQTNRQHPADGRYRAAAFRRFDAGAVDTGWDRLTLDLANFPSNTQVMTSYSATNAEAAAGQVTDLSVVPDAAASELAEAGVESLWDLVERSPGALARVVGDTTTDRAEEWQRAATERLDEATTWTTAASANQQDILLEDVSGRYLAVKLELIGGVDASPAVASLQAYCPKQTYLRYLPAYFDQPTGNGQFLERFLSVFESEFVDIESDIERVTEYFDPEGVPNEYLSWLGDWLAIEFDDEWPAGAKREFLQRAPTLFRLRGTKEGMRRIIRLYLRHVERPDTSWMTAWRRQRIEARRSEGAISDTEVGARLRQIDDRSSDYPAGHLLFFFEHLDLDGIKSPVARQPYTMHMDGPRSFVTFIGPFVDGAHREAVRRIVATERPAHTHGSVVELRQELKLEGGSFLGINSTLTTREFVLGRSTLGGDTVLKERQGFQ